MATTSIVTLILGLVVGFVLCVSLARHSTSPSSQFVTDFLKIGPATSNNVVDSTPKAEPEADEEEPLSTKEPDAEPADMDSVNLDESYENVDSEDGTFEDFIAQNADALDAYIEEESTGFGGNLNANSHINLSGILAAIEAEENGQKEPESEATAEPKDEATAEPKDEATAEPKDEATAAPDAQQYIAAEVSEEPVAVLPIEEPVVETPVEEVPVEETPAEEAPVEEPAAEEPAEEEADVAPEVTPEPTPEVTPQPTPEPTPEVTPEPTPEVVEPIIVPYGEPYSVQTQIKADGSERSSVSDEPYETLDLTLKVDAYKNPAYFQEQYATMYKLQGDEAAVEFDITLNGYTGTTEIIPQNFLLITFVGSDPSIAAQGYQLMDAEIGGKTEIAISSDVPSKLYKRYPYSAEQGDMVYMVVTTYNDGVEGVYWFEILAPEPEKTPATEDAVEDALAGEYDDGEFDEDEFIEDEDSGKASSKGGISLTVGSQGDDVKRLQKALIDLGLLQGAPDGKFGNYTAGAVKEMQKRFGMEQTGIADQAFLDRLYAN